MLLSIFILTYLDHVEFINSKRKLKFRKDVTACLIRLIIKFGFFLTVITLPADEAVLFKLCLSNVIQRLLIIELSVAPLPFSSLVQ